jgi:thioredoxin-related protein
VRQLWFVIIYSLYCLTAAYCTNVSADEKVSIKDLQNAAAQAQKANSSNKQLILYVAATNCPYCKKLNRDVIYPALANREYTSKFVIRRLWLNKNRVIIDFKNNNIDEQTLLNQYGIRYTPTLLFVDQNGKEIAPRLEGYAPDTLYWDRLDRSLKIAKES